MEQQEIAAIVAAVGEQMQAQISAAIAEALEPVLESVVGLEQKLELLGSPGVPGASLGLVRVGVCGPEPLGGGLVRVGRKWDD